MCSYCRATIILHNHLFFQITQISIPDFPWLIPKYFLGINLFIIHNEKVYIAVENNLVTFVVYKTITMNEVIDWIGTQVNQ